MADKYSGELAKMLRRQAHAVDVRTDHTTEHATAGGEGRTDSIVTFPSDTVFVEAKYGEAGWCTRYADPKKGWTLKQRAYAKWVVNELHKEVYIFLVVGEHPAHYDPSKYSPRKAFLIPFWRALEVVEFAELEGVNTLPYSINKNTRKILKKHNLSCVTAFNEYALSWVDSDTGWEVPFTHPFYEKYLRGITTGDFYQYPPGSIIAGPISSRNPGSIIAGPISSRSGNIS